MHILDTLEQCHLPKIRHYCDHSMNFIVAVPFENPMVASLTLGSAPDDDPAIDVLRLSLRGVASVHRSFLHSRGARRVLIVPKRARFSPTRSD